MVREIFEIKGIEQDGIAERQARTRTGTVEADDEDRRWDSRRSEVEAVQEGNEREPGLGGAKPHTAGRAVRLH